MTKDQAVQKRKTKKDYSNMALIKGEKTKPQKKTAEDEEEI